MSGVVGAACCCDEDHPCVGNPNCSAVAIVVEGTISYGIGATAEEGSQRVTLCDNECPPNTNPNDSQGEATRQRDRSFAEVFRVRFKALLAEGGFGNTGNYNTISTSGTYPPIISATARSTAQSRFESETGLTMCPPFDCGDSYSHRVTFATFDASGGGQSDQEVITNLNLEVSRGTRFVDCDTVPPCLGELLTPGCYEVYTVVAGGKVEGEYTFSKTENITFEEYVFPTGCVERDESEPPESNVVTDSYEIKVKAENYARIDEYQACPPQIPLPIDATELLLPGGGGSGGLPCNPNPDCFTGCCGLQEGGNTEYSYDDLGSLGFSPIVWNHPQEWVAILSNCDKVGTGNGNSASKSNSDSVEVNCGGPDSCMFAGDSEDPQPAPTTIKDLKRQGNIESNLVFELNISRKEPLYAMPDPALWPNGV